MTSVANANKTSPTLILTQLTQCLIVLGEIKNTLLAPSPNMPPFQGLLAWSGNHVDLLDSCQLLKRRR